VSGGGAHLHIHRTTYIKWSRGVELQSSYFNYFAFSEDDSLITNFHLITQTPATSDPTSPAAQVW